MLGRRETLLFLDVGNPAAAGCLVSPLRAGVLLGNRLCPLTLDAPDLIFLDLN